MNIRNRIRWVRTVLLGAAVAFCSSAFAAAEVWVAEDGSDGAAGTEAAPYGTIAYALTKCDAGGTVHVKAGTYEVTAEILVAQDVKVAGAGYATTTVKRKSGTTRVFHLNHADAVVSGLTLQNGSGVIGAGAYVEAGTLSSCHVTKNDCGNRHGGGVYLTGSSSVVTNCLIDYNSSSGWGALTAGAFVGSGALLVDSDVTWNMQASKNNNAGPGVGLSGGTVRRCRVMHNILDGDGYGTCPAGLCAQDAGGVIEGCLIAENTINDDKPGGGVSVNLSNNSSKLVICDTTIVANHASTTGGGIYHLQGATYLTNCVIQANTAYTDLQGAEYKLAGGTISFDHCVSPVALPGTDNVVATLNFSETENYLPDYHPAAVYAGWKKVSTNALDASLSLSSPALMTNATLTVTAYATPGKNGGALTYRWNFGDGSGWSAASSATTATHVYATPGKYTVTLEASAVGVEKPKTYTKEFRASPLVAHVVNPATHAGHVPVYPYLNENTAATNIQDAVDAVADGATVIVHPGTYSVMGEVKVEKGITLASSDGKDVTSVKSGLPSSRPSSQFSLIYLRRALYVNHPNAVARGLTLKGGSESMNSNQNPPWAYGSAVAVGAAGGMLLDCKVTDSQIGGKCYGALALIGASSVVTNCFVVDVSDGTWAALCSGVYILDGLMTHSVIANNKHTSNSAGGADAPSGLWMDGGRAEYLTITNNTTTGKGAVYMNGSTAVLLNSLVADNTADKDGGGVYQKYGTMVNCTVVGNKSNTGLGGGVFANGSNPKIYACLFTGNSASTAASADWSGASATYRYCSFSTDMPASQQYCAKGAVSFESGTYKPLIGQASYDLMPSDVYGDLGLSFDATTTLDYYGQLRLSSDKIDAGCAEYQKAAYEAVVELEARVKVGQAATFTVKDGGATGVEYSWRVDGGDWSDYSASANTMTTNFTAAGNHSVEARVKETSSGTLFGPYSCSFVIAPVIAHVIDPVQAEADGHVAVFPYDTWAKAATNVADAIAVACDGSSVVVSDGVYRITSPVELKIGATVRSVNGAARTELRNIVPESDPVKALHRVALVNHRAARLTGFTLSGGNSSIEVASKESYYGIGLQIGADGGTVSECVVSDNGSNNGLCGAGVAILGEDGVVSNCLITANYCGNYIRMWGAAGYVKAGLVTHCVISNNVNHGRLDESAVSFGTHAAGFYLTGGRVSHCLFADNRFSVAAAYDDPDNRYGGGAVYMTGAAVIDNCLFVSNNCSAVRGGAVLATKGTLLNCTICENSAGLGGGVFATSSDVTLRNCIIQDNVATDTTCEICGTPTATYSLAPSGLPAGEGNVTAPAVFKPGWKHRQRRSSPGVNAGSATGYEVYLDGTDLFGRPRVIGESVDIGADEVGLDGLMLMVR